MGTSAIDQDPLAAYRAAKAARAPTAIPQDDPLAAFRARQSAATVTPVVAAQPADDETPGEQFAGRLASEFQGATLGTGKFLMAGARTVLPEALGGEKGFDYMHALADYQNILDQYRARHPTESMAYEVAGSLPTAGVGAARAAVPKAASWLRRLATVAGEGAAVGGVTGTAEAIRPGATSGDVGRGAATGAVAGAVLAPAISAAAAPIVRGATRVAAKGVRVLSPDAAESLARLAGGEPVTPAGTAQRMLGDAAELGGVNLREAAQNVAADSPTSLMEQGSRNVASLVRGARNVPTSTAAQTTDRFLTERAAQTGSRVERALADATGEPATDVFLPVQKIIDQRAAEARPLYEKAYAHGEVQNPETVAKIQELLRQPVFKRAWRRGEALGELEGTAPAGTRPTLGTPARELSIRDERGQLRRDLRGVSDESLGAEWQRLAEMNAEEEGTHAAVEEAGYRADYHELPRTEKFGRRGQEDLPDADGMVDPDVLARDNKIVSDYRRGTLVREARTKLMDRIQQELGSRPSAGDFPFGESANATGTAGIDPKRLAELKAQGLDRFIPGAAATTTPSSNVRQIDLWKRGLDAVIESGHGSANALSRTEARAYRNALNDVLVRVDEEVPAYRAARENFRGHSELADAAEAGARHFRASDHGMPMTADAIARDYAALSPAEQEVYRRNGINYVVAKVRQAAANERLPEAGRTPNILQKVLGTEDQADRLAMLFPDEKDFQTFLTRVEDEALYPKTSAFLRNQSSTEAQRQEGQVTAGMLRNAVMSLAPGVGPLARRRLVEQVVAKGLGTDTKIPPPVADEIGRQATMTGTRLKALLEAMANDRAAREAGRQRLSALFVKPAAIGAAEATKPPT